MQDKKEYSHKWALWVLILSIIVVALIIILLFQGKTTTTGNGPDKIVTEALVCKSKIVPYSRLSVERDTEKELLIKMIFRDDILSTISLTYTLWYGDPKAVIANEARLHADMNINLGKAGYTESDFNKKFSRLDDRLIMSLYADGYDIVAESAPYFMIRLNDEHIMNLKTIDDYMKNYQEQGLECEKS